jgi:hypothetical protein
LDRRVKSKAGQKSKSSLCPSSKPGALRLYRNNYASDVVDDLDADRGNA